MKTAIEIVKALAEIDPIISVRQFGDTEDICYYCKKDQYVEPYHHPDCLWLEMQQIALELKNRDELTQRFREGVPLEEFIKEFEMGRKGENEPRTI